MLAVIDFDIDLLKDERARNYEPHGGGLRKVASAERETQERREASTLMVVYASRSDIPPSPKEPAEPYTGEHVAIVEFGNPPEDVAVRATPPPHPASRALARRAVC